MPTLLEMATDIVSAHVSNSPVSKEDLISELQEVYKTLSAIEKGEAVATVEAEEAKTEPAVSKRKAFGKNQILCMICGKGMKALTRHLKTAHEMTPKEYRTQFDIPRTQPLAAKAYSESRRQMAVERGLVENLAKARAAKEAKKKPARKRASAKKGAGAEEK